MREDETKYKQTCQQKAFDRMRAARMQRIERDRARTNLLGQIEATQKLAS